MRRRTAVVQPPFRSAVCKTIARTCLRDEHHTILETALELGFADNTGFHRAFKRWTGLTPTEYRSGARRSRSALVLPPWHPSTSQGAFNSPKTRGKSVLGASGH
jgi:hypothetical protein